MARAGSNYRQKEFVKEYDRLCSRNNRHQVWSDFVYMAAAAISNAVDKRHAERREEQYMAIVKKYNREDKTFGSSLDNANARRFQGGFTWNTFTSIEPLTEYMNMGLGSFGSDRWTIIGAETGNRKGKILPAREWIDNIVEAAAITGVKIFMKESLRELMGDDFRQEFPWDDCAMKMDLEAEKNA